MSLSAIVGHRQTTLLLSQAIARQTLPPTLMIAGPAGVGKFALARAVAAVLNCLTPIHGGEAGADVSASQPADAILPLDACGRCRGCTRIDRAVHVDVLVLTPDDRASIKIDVVRDVLDRTSFRPFEGRRRVVIIRDAESLEQPAQNALLKSLEEPPPATVFVLTTAVPGALLPTVRSRCMTLRVGPLTDREVTALLVRDHGMPEADARAAAAIAGGRIGEALALGSTDVAVCREAALLLLQHAARNAAVPGRLQAAAVLASTPSKKERTREELSLILRMLASMLRDVEVYHAGGETAVLANQGIANELAAVSRSYSGDRAREAFVAVDRALMALERNAGIKVVSEWLAVQM